MRVHRHAGANAHLGAATQGEGTHDGATDAKLIAFQVISQMGGRTSWNGFWSKVPISLRAIVSGLVVGLVAANVWPLLLLALGLPVAALAEAVFLSLYVWWVSGGGPPERTHAARVNAFRRKRLSSTEWLWGLIGALFFAATVHASIVLLFRLVPFPVAEFRRGYDLSSLPSPLFRWVAVVGSAISAAICEETGFRGYMQRPIEQRHGVTVAVLVSSLFFMAVHLTKAWSVIGMVPIVLGAGVLLGLLAHASGSLIPGMIGHTVMDIGLFAYWWAGLPGTFTALPISRTGVDKSFVITCAVLGLSLLITLISISRLRRIAKPLHIVSF